MSYGIGKKDNLYARRVADIDAPKTAWMAIAFSIAMRLTADKPIAAYTLIRREWELLFDNGIVPQRPRRHPRDVTTHTKGVIHADDETKAER